MFVFSPHARIWLFFLSAGCLLTLVIFSRTGIYGDGQEYLGMTIAIASHGTPELRDTDIRERQLLDKKNGITWTASDAYAGYFEDMHGRFYSYHFWAYPALCSIPYIILKSAHTNPMRVFKLVNALLLLLLLWWILYRADLDGKMRVWLAVALFFSPIWLYVQWSHPEVFTFTFLSIGLLELLNNRRRSACFFIAAASLQNPPVAIALLPLAISEIRTFWITRKLSSESVQVFLVALMVFLPSAFYWVHYHASNMIVKKGMASIGYISLSKIVNLFTDLNFGIIIYIPLLSVALVVLLFRRDKAAMLWSAIILVVATAVTTSGNWNCGMMNISRYGVWMIPLIVTATYGFFNRLSSPQLIGAILLYTLSTGAITAYCLKDNDFSNYIRLGPLARVVLSVAPSLYSPPYEVFIERMTGTEVDWNKLPYNEFPYLYVDSRWRLLKGLDIGENGRPQYINAPMDLSRVGETGKLVAVTRNIGDNDVFTKGMVTAFLQGWYGLEGGNNLPKWRWVNKDAGLLIYMPHQSSSMMDITLYSFAVPRTCVIRLNNEMVFTGSISSSGCQDIEFPITLKKGTNAFYITSPEPDEAPCELPMNNPDTRKLSFCILRVGLR